MSRRRFLTTAADRWYHGRGGDTDMWRRIERQIRRMRRFNIKFIDRLTAGNREAAGIPRIRAAYRGRHR